MAKKHYTKGYFPLIVVLNADQNVLGNVGYKKATPTEYISHLNNFIN